MKKITLLFLLVAGVVSGFAQDCVKIESILVDACTFGNDCGSSSSPTCNCEGKNEMLRFRLGNNPKSVSDLVINWPNNNFLGICQNAQTAANTAELNATIEACGWLLEPVNGVLPANSKVLVVTSTDMCTASNSFAGLSDTLYIIYQCPGNYYGHFANFGSGFRTTTLSFGGGCTSNASYNRALLVSETGINMAADGATVDFPVGGAPVYYNNGCNAPVPVETLDAGEGMEICPGEVIELEGYIEGDFTDWFWSGGSGTFDNPNDLNTQYTPGTGDINGFTLTLSANNCNGVLTDQVEFSVLSEEVPVITPSGPIEICPGETLELTATGNGEISWSTGETGSSIWITEAGNYSAALEGVCGINEVSVEVIESTNASLTVLPAGEVEICEGETVQLTATGSGDFVWSNGSIEAMTEVNAPGIYTVTLTNSCGTFEESVVVSVQEPPVLTLLSPPEILLCEGASVVLETAGTGDFSWSNGMTGSSITISETGIYTVTLSNDCGSDSKTIVVSDGGSLPTADIIVNGSTSICPGESTVLTAVTDDDFLWGDGSAEATFEVFSPGTYTLLATNQCGSTTVEIEITLVSVPLVTISDGATTICHGEPVLLRAVSSLPVQWSTGSTNKNIEVDNAGEYYVSVSNACGTDTAFVDVLSGNPLADFTIVPDTGSAPLDAYFTNHSSNADSFNWYVNDQFAGDDEQFDYTFYKPGNYEITLVASDSVGCTDSYTQELPVKGCEEALVYIPNSFTPNGDGVNDLFKFTTGCVAHFELNIFNRYGMLVYSAQKGDAFWDGSDGTGYYVSDGVYLYTFRYTGFDGMNKDLKGTITVFR